jgi:hypothetical protein
MVGTFTVVGFWLMVGQNASLWDSKWVKYQAPCAFAATLFCSFTAHAVFGVKRQYFTLPW